MNDDQPDTADGHQPGQSFEVNGGQQVGDTDISPPTTPIDKKLMVISLLLALVAYIGLAVLFVSRFSGSDQQPFISVFEDVSPELTDQELLSEALTRALDVQNVSYSIDFNSITPATGSVSYVFSGDKQMIYANTQINDDNGDLAFGIEVFTDAGNENTYFKINELGDESTGGDWDRFVGKWVLINDETTQNIAAGSEYIGLLLFQGLGWELPFLVGNIAAKDAVVSVFTDSSNYAITASENVVIEGRNAVKLTVQANKQNLSEVLDPYTGLDATDRLNATTPGLVLYVSRFAETPAEPVEFSITILKSNAQIIAAEYINNPQDADSISIGRSGEYRYTNFSFNRSDLPKEPKDWLPFNEFYPTN